MTADLTLVSAATAVFEPGDVIRRAEWFGAGWWRLGRFVRYADDADEFTGGPVQPTEYCAEDRICWLRGTETGSKPFPWWASQVRHAYCEQVGCRAADEPYRAHLLIQRQQYGGDGWTRSCGVCARAGGPGGVWDWTPIGPLPLGPPGGFRYPCRHGYRAWKETLPPADRALAELAEAAARYHSRDRWSWVQFARAEAS
jgi:hypothetical protein